MGAPNFTKKHWNEFLEYAKQENLFDPKDDRPFLSEREVRLANSLQRQANGLGYDIQITTLTQISKKISDQKYYTIPFADYVPVVVGEGAYSDQITTYRTFNVSDDFETGMVNNGSQNSRLASADAAVDSVSTLTYQWAKEITWSILELEFASRSGNWNLVTSKEKSRKENWDLGLQKIAFLGANGNNASNGSCLGLLNLYGITTNTAIIPKALSSMTPTELKTFQQLVVNAYRTNNNRTRFPNRFAIPESDFLGLASQSSPDFPIKSTLQLLEEAFKVVCGDDFRIMPVAYADAAYHTGISQIAGKQVYTLYHYDEETFKMDIPVDYTNTLANSLNNFQMQNVGYGQFTGIQVLRPLELMYFTY